MHDGLDSPGVVWLWLLLGVAMVPIYALFVIAAAPVWGPLYAYRRWRRRAVR
jgi:hypothetical protein